MQYVCMVCVYVISSPLSIFSPIFSISIFIELGRLHKPTNGNALHCILDRFQSGEHTKKDTHKTTPSSNFSLVFLEHRFESILSFPLNISTDYHIAEREKERKRNRAKENERMNQKEKKIEGKTNTKENPSIFMDGNDKAMALHFSLTIVLKHVFNCMLTLRLTCSQIHSSRTSASGSNIQMA